MSQDIYFDIVISVKSKCKLSKDFLLIFSLKIYIFWCAGVCWTIFYTFLLIFSKRFQPEC